MNTPIKSQDWMLVTVRGYDLEKGYIFGNRHPDGEGVIIAKKNSVKKDWLKSMSSERERTFTPPKSIIAVFGADLLDEKTGFTIASWATPVSKNPGNEDVFVTPIKISATPKQLKSPQKNEKSLFIDATVMDQYARPVREIEELQKQVLDCLSNNSPSSFNLAGPRGFMIRIGHTATDGSFDATGWEFFGRTENSPQDTWNFYWNQAPQQGRNQNLLKAILTAAQHAFRDPASYVEVVGLSRVLINDFGVESKVHELAALPNYKVKTDNGILSSYSLAAISVENSQLNRIIKQQIPLPRNKIVNSLSGLLGNHIPGNSLNPIIKPIVDTTIIQSKVEVAEINGNYPLGVVDHVNQHGEVRSFEVYGSKENLEQYKDRIENAIQGITPFKVRGKDAYSFPLKFKKEVQSSLFDLTGGAPLYTYDIEINGSKYIGILGQISIEPYKSLLDETLHNLNAVSINNSLLVEERFRPQLVASLNAINDYEPRPLLSSANPLPLQPKRSDENTSSDNDRISFSKWQEEKFGKSPDAMMHFLSGEIAAYATEAGIDWESAIRVVDFPTPNSKGDLVRSKEVHPFDKAHAGSVAMAAHVIEKFGKTPGDSIVWFKINFFNKKLLKDRVITFDSYQFLKDEYDRDVKNGFEPSKSKAEIDAIKRESAIRAAEAEARRNKTKMDEENSRAKWARLIPTMPKETGENSYWSRKGVSSLLNEINAKTGIDKDLGRFTVIPLHDLNNNYLGAQRIFENSWSDAKGRSMNKKYVYGTLLKNEQDLPYGTHYLVGEINPLRPIMFCEGFADAGTNRAATGLPVVVCLDKTNLKNLVGMYRQAYPDTRLIIAHDNDIYNKKNGNVGFISALDAAKSYSAEFVGPDFSALDQNAMKNTPTDFNDLQQLVSLEEVKRQLRNIRKAPNDNLEFHKLKVQAIGLDNLESYLKDAVNEIVSGNTISENSVYRSLLLRAILTYGHDEVLENISEATKQYLNTPLEIEPTKQVHNYPVSITEKDGTSGKKFSLIIDHEGTNTSQIELALTSIVGKNHLPFNEHLNGWVAPYQVIRLLDSYLYELTGAPRLYIGQSRSKDSPHHHVIRGNFSDVEFKQNVAETIKYANPYFMETEYGFVIPDARAIPYIKESLKSYLADNKDLSIRVQESPTAPALNERSLDQAVLLSGEPRGNIVLALYTLIFQNEGQIFRDDDFAFASIYSRSLNLFSHLETEARHSKALADSVRTCNTILDHGVAETAIDITSVERLKEIVEQLSFLNVPSVEASREIHAQTTNISTGSGSVSVSENKLDDIGSNPPATTEADEAPLSESDIKPQILRVNQLLEIVRLVVDKGFDEEDLYEHFITQPASPYYDYSKGSFDDVLYRQDLLFLSTSDEIEGWKPTTIHTTSQLYYAIYNDVARDRITKLESYINNYLEEVGPTTFKTFNKYLSGQQEIPNGLTHPYLMEGEVNFDLIAHDLEHLTQLTSIHDLFRELTASFSESEKARLNEIQDDIFNDHKVDDKSFSIPETIYESLSSNVNASIVKYSVSGIELYELRLKSVINEIEQPSIQNFHFDKDQLIQYASNVLKENPTSLRFASLPNYTDSGISTSITDKVYKNGLRIELKEVDLGSKSFYIVDKFDSFDRSDNSSNYFENYNEAEDFYNNLVKSSEERLDVNQNSQTFSDQVNNSKTNNPEKENLGQRFREWAKKSIPAEDVIETLKSQYRMVLSPENEKSIKKQYQQLVSKISQDNAILNVLPEERFIKLNNLAVQCVNNEITYDEFLDDFFKSNGLHVERNPYWNNISGSIDRKTALIDIQRAGFKSLHQFYESVYTSIHKIKSTDHHLRRVGGFIPTTLDLAQPLRPQFQNLNELFNSINTESDYKVSLLPFNDWVQSQKSLRAVHPILGEDIADITSVELSEKYSNDALLLLADIHGINVTADMNKNTIAKTIIDQWETRKSLSTLSSGEISNLEPVTLTEYLQKLNLPIGGSALDRTQRITEHCDVLRSLSKLRIAQYSYINSAIEFEKAHGAVPSYCYRSICSFIANEVDFIPAVKSNITEIEKAKNRKEIDLALSLISNAPPAGKILKELMEYPEPRLYGLDSNRESAIVFSDNYDKLKGSLSRYKFKYQTDINKKFDSSQLPGEITHFVLFGDNLIGTPSPIDNNRLSFNKMIPVSESAIASASAPLSQWINRFGYGCFSDSDGNHLLCHKVEDQWNIVKLTSTSFENLYSVSNVEEFLNKESPNLHSFVDRNPVIESMIENVDSTLVSSLRRIANSDISLPEDNKYLMNDLNQILSKEPFVSLLGSDSDEMVQNKVKILAYRLERELFEGAWLLAQSNENSFESILKSAQSFNSIINPGTSDLSPTISILEFSKLEPTEAIELYDNYIRTDKTFNQTLFQQLEDRFFNTLPSNEKHLLSVEIASGSYESIGHFLHEKAIEYGISNGISEAKDIHNRFYSSNPSLDADNNFTADTPELGKLYLSIESDRSLFIEVAAVDGDNVIGTEISLSSSTDSNSIPFSVFRTYPEAMIPNVPHLAIDPTTENGVSQLNRLPLDKLMDFAQVYGVPSPANRESILKEINDIVEASKITKALRDNVDMILKEDQLSIASKFVGYHQENHLLLNALDNWDISRSGRYVYEILNRNYEMYKQGSRDLEYNNKVTSPIIRKRDGLIPVFSLPDLKFISQSINDIRDIPGYLRSGDAQKQIIGHAFLEITGLCQSSLERIVASINNDVLVKPVQSNLSLMWATVKHIDSVTCVSEYSSLDEAVLNSSLPRSFNLIEGDKVAWIENSQIHYGHAATNVGTDQNFVTITISDSNGRNFVKDISTNEICKVDDEDLHHHIARLTQTFSDRYGGDLNRLEDLVNSDRDFMGSNLMRNVLLDRLKMHILEVSKDIMPLLNTAKTYSANNITDLGKQDELSLDSPKPDIQSCSANEADREDTAEKRKSFRMNM